MKILQHIFWSINCDEISSLCVCTGLKCVDGFCLCKGKLKNPSLLVGERGGVCAYWQFPYYDIDVLYEVFELLMLDLVNDAVLLIDIKRLMAKALEKIEQKDAKDGACLS